MNGLEAARKTILGVQMLFVAFGALVLVPLLTGLDPCIALFTAGAGTLLFHALTGFQVPIFLASSFAFIAPIQAAIPQFGLAATLGALVCTGVVYFVLSAMVRVGGVELINRYLPPIVTGPVIMIIGLKLAPVAVNMATSLGGNAHDGRAMFLAGISLLTAILVVMKGRGLLQIIPVLCGIIVGYGCALAMGLVDFTPVKEAPWFCIPWVPALAKGTFAWPRFDWAAVLFILPVTLAPAIEHVGDILAISSVTGKNFIVKPGLHRTLLGDGLATSLAAALGGPPNTTYSEVTGAIALTKAFNPAYLRIAAVTAILLAFVGKLGAILKTIPTPVMGGILILLFGMIAAIGIGTLVRSGTDMGKSRNLVISAVILVAGLGDLQIGFGRFSLSGIGLASILGVILHLVLPDEKSAPPPAATPKL